MGLGGLLGVFGHLPNLISRNDDDIYDRLNHRWTAGIIVVFAIVVTTKTYIRESPITCWAPKDFASSWEKYVNSYCWIKNTYYYNFDDDIPRDPLTRQNHNPIIYYQWVPMILLLQAFFFYTPIVIWRRLNDKSGIDVNDIVETAEKYRYTEDPGRKNKVLYYLVKQLHRALVVSRKPGKFTACCQESCWKPNCRWIISNFFCCICDKKISNYMVILYFTIKIIFLFNSVGQLFLLNWFLGQNFSMYGFDVMNAWMIGQDWRSSPRFPRVTLCDLDVRRLANINRYTLQCVLPINLFNEIIFLIIWFWLVFLSVVTFWGLIVWMFRFSMPCQIKNYIISHLRVTRSFSPERRTDQETMDKFVNDYLGSDGFLVIRLIDLNTNKQTVQDFISSLWEHYRDLPSVKPALLLDASNHSPIGFSLPTPDGSFTGSISWPSPQLHHRSSNSTPQLERSDLSV